VSWTGGCQCGAIRFRVEGQLGEASICHCRMCQKATGGLFGPYVSAATADLVWSRGEPRRFQSSNKVRRGFCGACGTPLAYDFGVSAIELSIGAFDDPELAAPTIQVNPADKLGSKNILDRVNTANNILTPAKTDPGICGCLIPDTDSDHDGRDEPGPAGSGSRPARAGGGP